MQFCDQDGKPFPGLSFADTTPLAGDDVRSGPRPACCGTRDSVACDVRVAKAARETRRESWSAVSIAQRWGDVPSDPESLLNSARQAFPYLYGRAPADDADRLDALVMIHAAVLIGVNAPRPEPGQLRTDLEQKTDSAEAKFMDYRAAVRRCPTFLALDELERAEIERILFDVRLAQTD